MPSRPRTQHPIDTSDSPATEAAAPASPRPATPRDDPDAEAVWIRVGVPGPPADEPSDDTDRQGVSVADVESALDGLGVEVEALAADSPEGASDLQRVVDRYERLIAERDRTIRERGTADRRGDPGRGALAVLRSALRAVADRFGR